MRYTQPQSGPTLIDYGNPITNGLEFAKTNPGSNSSPSLGAATASTPLATEVKKLGLSTRFTGNSGGYVTTGNAGKGAKGTILVLHQSTLLPPNGTPYYSHVLAATTSGGVTGNGWLLMLGNGNGYLLFRAYNTDTGTQIAGADGSTALNDGVPHVTIATWGNTTSDVLTTYVDGKQHAVSGALSSSFTSLVPMRIANTSDTHNFWGYLDGNIYLVLSWTRILSQAEIKSMSANPWQLFKSPQRVMLAAAGSDVIIALTGQATTAAAGNLVPSTAAAVGGQSATATQGSIAPAVAIGLSGQSSGAQQGLLTPTRTIVISGLSSTSAVGTVSPGISAAIIGQASTTQQGILAPSGNITVALTGQAASVAQGVLTRSTPEAVFSLATIMRQSAIAVQAGTMKPTVAAQGGTLKATIALSTIMRQSQINTRATMTNASINRTVAFI